MFSTLLFFRFALASLPQYVFLHTCNYLSLSFVFSFSFFRSLSSVYSINKGPLVHPLFALHSLYILLKLNNSVSVVRLLYNVKSLFDILEPGIFSSLVTSPGVCLSSLRSLFFFFFRSPILIPFSFSLFPLPSFLLFVYVWCSSHCS